MEIIKKIFMVIGIIFTILILLIGVIIIIKPYGIDITKIIPAILNKTPISSYDHPYLTTQQESILESVGINPEDVPTQITPQQQECTTSILGAERINKIMAGEIPTLIEIIQIKSCFDL